MYILGKVYFAGMEPDNYERAYKAVQKAIEISGNTTEKEKALIKSYVPEPVEDRRELDVRYSAAKRKLYNIFNEVPEIAALYADSLMDLYPWNLYDKVESLKNKRLM